jgi:hypothetical protein
MSIPRLKTVILCFLASVLFISCSKERRDESVQVRVKNETINRIVDVKVYALSGNNNTELEKAYGTINTNSASNYIGYAAMYNLPLLSYTIPGSGSIDIDRVRCATPLPSTLPAGRYTLLVSGDYNNPDVSLIRD